MDGAGNANDPIELDVIGLNCPLPVMRTRRALSDLPRGARLVVRASDPLAAIDIPHFCTEAGHRLLSMREDGRVLVFAIEKGVDPD
ncbi:tRNA 2-thiouridine synthesizing protein A [Pseudoxanthobacter soli DSM 19599]|uniref:tRNA 2-thiouridine synthesizing protein A n=1 Tax=Pseudoxanthobacter soli DSM 19599 TaxID=1123029 RepID=A0A1M7ZIK3_9HYPH|nr:sulfurtransferase TusA family protein [Pseudoxanthobacter soli]SHO64711.1 tRNA 2-thiouridine synthesizing protein A [Pseudoxanthobacter soli DSM 19599]